MTNVRCVDGDILEARAFCNPVNLVGAMGKGLAAQVARRWPACLGAYRAALQTRALRAGTVSAWRRRDGGWILQVPTKRHWRDRSPLELVAASIRAIGPACARHGITEIAVPPLGCGLGGLDPAGHHSPGVAADTTTRSALQQPLVDLAKAGLDIRDIGRSSILRSPRFQPSRLYRRRPLQIASDAPPSNSSSAPTSPSAPRPTCCAACARASLAVRTSSAPAFRQARRSPHRL